MTQENPSADRLTVSLPQSRQIVTEIPGPVSRQKQQMRREHVVDGFGVALPVFVDALDRGVVQDVDGNRFIDFSSGIAVTSLGASHPRVQERLSAQMARFTHTCFMVMQYEAFVDVARWLNRNTPGDFEKRTALFSTGAEAIENAIKIARVSTGRSRVLVFDEAYHGRSLLTMAMTAKVNPYKRDFGPFPSEIVRAPSANPLRGEGSSEEITARALERVEETLLEHGAEEFAAMVIEPIQGEGGFVVPAPGFLAGLEEIAKKYGIVFIIDEIQTGMGRTGELFASTHEGIAGDITVTAKALAAGLPLSAVTGRAEIMNAVPAGGLGGTYAGNPLACEAALAVFEVLAEEPLLETARMMQERFLELFDDVKKSTRVLGDVRGRGAMLALEFADPDTLEPLPDLAQEVSARCHEAGVLTLVCGTHNNVIRLLPPLVMDEGLFTEGLEILAENIRKVDAN